MSMIEQANAFHKRHSGEGSNVPYVLCAESPEHTWVPFAIAHRLPLEPFAPFAIVAVDITTNEVFRRMGVSDARWV